MNDPFLLLESLTVNIGGKKILSDVNLLWEPEQQWAIIGMAGSGKTTLAHTLAGKHFYTGRITSAFFDSEHLCECVSIVEQQHRFKNIFNRNEFYYQQRYNASDAENTQTVRELLEGFVNFNNDRLLNGWSWQELTELMQLGPLMDEPLIQLSNGENKRLQILEVFLQKKELLILDQPFIGLDSEGRASLHHILGELTQKNQKLLIICSGQEIPDCISHVAELEAGCIVNSVPRSQYHFQNRDLKKDALRQEHFFLNAGTPISYDFQYAIKMVDTNIRYGDKNILEHINWEVRKGEKWYLSGPNGAGKSTLLSLITGDNPQAYANEIYLFDRRRGSGESIWDIKRKIGYVSPELHLYFDTGLTCRQTIASGFFDTIGLFRQVNREQEDAVTATMKMLSIIDKGNDFFFSLSLGEQRLVLLARALIKNPPLLILDEPCQGLDADQTNFFRNFVNRYCTYFQTTLIYVSHYPQELPGTVNCFLRLEKGLIVSVHNGNQYS